MTDETTPRGSADEQPQTGVMLHRPAIVAMLFLLNIVFGFSVFVGVILAYIWRGDDETLGWEKSHFTYLIRTFWIGTAAFVVTLAVWISTAIATIPPGDAPDSGMPGAFLAVIFGMFAVWIALAVWFCTRCIVSLVKAGNRQPITNPATWWV